ncbi:site-specific integrase [Actinokineospora sp. PR83]|uniref:tyrosine-type recombinase/integrase n=1 Tax=Actinokineospora sp. PR83 TaxID=2884908 RepID=UPI001F3FDB95|nr:site-specific integrase [Actinokineospora sp. PR83]MCG8917897.1 site-specific integrase [Actinokineospora sp. PR83]
MAGKRRRRFGSVRKLPSGRFQAGYLGPDGQRRWAPETFESKTAAEKFLVKVESLMMAGEWADPEKSKVKLGDYIEQWITQRPKLSPRTVELYRWLHSKYLQDRLGDMAMGKVTTAVVRQWRVDLITGGVSETMIAKAYRLLRAVFNTAVDDDRILVRNPCRIRGADQESAAERPVLSVAQVFELADRMPVRRYRVMILLTAFCTLRWGEVSALRRCDVAEDGSWVRVSQAFTEVVGQGLVIGPPKSRAGVRTLAVPVAIRADLVAHLAEFTGPAADALVFTGEKKRALRRSNFSQRVKWTELVAEMGLKGLHFHDLRHAGNIWAAQAGVSTKDLMARMGHDDMRAALIYQRATSEADLTIADRLSALVDRHREKPTES